METQHLSDTFSLFHNINTDILERFLSLANQEKYQSGEIIIDEENWGRAMFFVVSGWVKIENISSESKVTIEIIGKGGFFGEEGILMTNNINNQVIALSNVELLAVPAQRFLQFLYQYTQIQNRLLTITVRKVKEYQEYCQFYRQAMKVRLTNILINLAEKYGEVTEEGIKIYNFATQDLANLSQLSLSECSQMLTKLELKSLIKIEKKTESLYILNLKLLHHIIGKLGNN